MKTDTISYLLSKRDEDPYHKFEKGMGWMDSALTTALGATEGQVLEIIQLRLRGATTGETKII